jgi:hypothetical protein
MICRAAHARENRGVAGTGLHGEDDSADQHAGA